MATTTNYSFEKPTVGGSEDTWGADLNDNWDSLDAKLIERSSATGSAKLPTGTTAQRDGTPAAGWTRYNTTTGTLEVYTGTSWVNVILSGAAGTSGMIFLDSQDLSNDPTANFTGFDATLYDNYLFELQSILPVTDNANLIMRTSTDGGSTYDSGASDYAYTAMQRDTGGAGGFDSTGAAQIVLCEIVGNDTGETGVSGSVLIEGPHLSSNTPVNYKMNHKDSIGRLSITNGGGQRLSAADVDAVRFLFDSGDILSGTITMYGLVNS